MPHKLFYITFYTMLIIMFLTPFVLFTLAFQNIKPKPQNATQKQIEYCKSITNNN